MKEFEFLDGEVTLTHRGERHYHAAQGSWGGAAGAFAVSTIVRANGVEETIRSKLLTTVKAGDRLVVETAGGGGYGSPADRDRDAVQRDVDDGKVSAEAAATVYGLAR